MSTGNKKRTRSERVAAVALPPGVWGHVRLHLRRGHVLVRLLVCALAAIALCVITQGWAPPMSSHLGDVPPRDVTARIPFEQIDVEATQQARAQARRLAVAVYEQDAAPLVQLRARLENDVSLIVAAADYASVAGVWNEFRLQLAEGTPEPTEEERLQQFTRFKEALSAEGALDAYKTALAEAMKPLEQNGLLDALPRELDINFEKIAVRPVGDAGFEAEVPTNDVLIETAATALKESLDKKMPSLEVAGRTFAWLRPKLPVTLKLNSKDTLKEQDMAAAAVQPRTKVFTPGSVLAAAGQKIDDASLSLLTLEYNKMLAEQPLGSKFARSLAVFGMYLALYTMCGFYIFSRAPQIANELPRLATLLVVVVLTIGLMLVTGRDQWRAEVIPLLLFGMMITIAYGQELSLLLSAAVTLIATQAIGLDLGDAVVMMASAVSAILLLRRVRRLSKLLMVGFVAAGVAVLTTVGVGTLDGAPFWPTLTTAMTFGLWAVVTGPLMMGLLPVVERVFGVQTDWRLFELGDPAHPLLQELIRRAPGTYNHSITVASLAEAAAEAIGARGLLVRVGAYFHDIGKMLKPGYFIENQGQGDNRHQTLMPAMSTLVIIAHVKDGADLARQNKIPEPIIDFIQQHHGTTLVEYFYRQASERSKAADADGGNTVDESSFRYPGPKPQTREAGILMLADAVESASRVLVEPTPSRIESLVEELSRKRLLDGQFDECGLTLQEVDKIGQSLVKSLTAVYHGRVKYPDQETA